ncbi:hypothetical protein D3C81_1064390 [compost metagenome]
MFGHQPGLRIEVQRGAVQGAAGALDHADHQIGCGASAEPRQRLGFRAGYVDGIGKIAGKGFAPLRQAIAQLRTKAFAFGITAQQRFRHHHQPGAGFDDCVFIGQDLFQGFSLAAGQGADLQGRDN